jgi:hypothetical protein
MSVLFRPHRGWLADSIAEVRTVECIEDIEQALDIKVVEVKPYGFDSRIAWDTYIVMADLGIKPPYVAGFTNGPLSRRT